MKTIPEQFNLTAERFAKRPALKFKYQGAYIKISFAELKRRVDTLSSGLQVLGIQKGDRIAILSENRSEWIRMDLASLQIGAITVPIHTTLSPKLIQHVINDSAATLLLVSTQEQFNKLQLVLDQLPKLKTIVYITLHQPDEANTFGKNLLQLEAVMEMGEKHQLQTTGAPEIDDVASIVYTSGTTALPKGVVLTHKNFMSNAMAAVTAVPITEKDQLLSFLPLSHVLERTAGYYASFVYCGACVAFAEDIKTLKTNLREIKPTVIISVPRVFEKIHHQIWDKIKEGSKLKRALFVWALKQERGTFKHFIADKVVFKKIRHAFGGKFRITISGGASLNHKLARFFDRVGIKIVEGYGLTECAPIITVNRPENIKFGTVGQQLAGTEIRLGSDKEILVKGPGVMQGYYNNPALTAETIDSDGWLHTGDLGFITSEGFLIIIGRKKEMIALSNGKIAWPEQLELLLSNDRFITQSIVLGQNRSHLSALLVPDWQEVNRTLSEIGITSREPAELVREPKLVAHFQKRLDAINDQLADWEKIRTFALLPKEFSQERDELTPTLKLRRATIVSNNQKIVDSLYS